MMVSCRWALFYISEGTIEGLSCGCAPSFLQGFFQRVNEALSLSVGPWVIWGDRDMIDQEGLTKILKVTARKLGPIVRHETINYPGKQIA